MSFLTIILLAYRDKGSELNRTYFAYYYLVINGILTIPMWLGILYIYSNMVDLTYVGITANILTLLASISLNSELIVSMGAT